MAHVGPIRPTDKVGTSLEWRTTIPEFEVPTWLIAIAIYGGWLALMSLASEIPWIATAILGGVLIAWQNSLQHEAVHGHPTRWRIISVALGIIPLGLWMPYLTYSRLHLSHHRTTHLTYPGRDTESFYFDSKSWARFPGPVRWLLTFNNTLLGRLTVGPAIAMVRFWYGEFRELGIDTVRVTREWAVHLILSVGLLYLVVAVCGVPLWVYLAACYFGLSLTLLRSYTEHRPAPTQDARSALVEAGWFWRLLYLSNNLHALHHRSPDLPWYQLSRIYRDDREMLKRANRNFVFWGYSDVFSRYILSVKDTPLHPSTAANEAD